MGNLPVVTYGTYNYGDYARPTPIKYKGGWGEALTGAATAFIKADTLKRRKQEAQIKQANEQSLLLSSQFQQKLNAAFGKASVTNRQFLQGLKKEYGDTVKSYKLDKLSFDEYEERINYYQGILDDATQLATIMKPIVESETEVGFENVRPDKDNQAAVLVNHSIKNGKYILEKDENGLRVVLAHGAGPSEFVLKSMSAKDLINNSKMITPEAKYDHLTNPEFNRRLDPISRKLLLNSKLINIVKDPTQKKKLLSLNPDKREEIIQEILTDQSLRSIFSNKDGGIDRDKEKTYYEDSMGRIVDGEFEINGLESYKGTDEQKLEIRRSIAEDMADTLIKSGTLKAEDWAGPETKTEDTDIYSKVLGNIWESSSFPKSILTGQRIKLNEKGKYAGMEGVRETVKVVNKDLLMKKLNSFKQKSGFTIKKSDGQYFAYGTNESGNIITSNTKIPINLDNMEETIQVVMGMLPFTTNQYKDYLKSRFK